MESTPESRITTHYCSESYVDRQQGHRVGEIPESLVREVQILHLRGLTRTAILHELRLGAKTYDRVRQIIIQRSTHDERVAMVMEMLSRGVSERCTALATGLSRTTIQKYKRKARAK